VNPVVRYTLARLGLFIAVAAVMLVLPIGLSLLLRLAIAVLVSAVLAYFLLGKLREETANQLAAAATRRAERKRQLRSALAGDDQIVRDGPDETPKHP
jgi:dipeptide/tripeptide permease